MPQTSPVSALALRDAAILIVDDHESNVRILARILAKEGFRRVHTTTDPKDVVRLYQELAPDLIMLDVRMPEMDGFDVLAQLRALTDPEDFLPVLAITGDASSETRKRVIVAGAKDFLEKPFHAAEVIVRVENLLTTRLLHRSLHRQNDLLEQKVHERTAQLERAVVAAEAASRSKSQFLATMSHELRTPLNAVIGFSNHLRKNKSGNLQAQDLTFLERIGDNGIHLLEIINDILDLSRIEAGKMHVEATPVALEQLIPEIVGQVVSGTAGTKPVTSRVSIPRDLKPLLTDEAKLRRILVNLIGNAAKFTERGYFLVGVRSDAAGTPVRIDVIDTGIGIPTSRLAAIFDVFEQADNSTQRRFGGTGLGLAISRTLCELLGCRLTVSSEEGVGSAFSLLLDPAVRPPLSYAELASGYDEASVMCA